MFKSSYRLIGTVFTGSRVSEPACFGAALAPGIFYPEPVPAPGKREQDFGIFKTNYIHTLVSKIRSNTCPSSCRSYFMLTLEKTSYDVKFHSIFVNY